MMKKIKSLSEIFAKNRAEELPDDVWKMFVHPRNQTKIDLRKWSKSTIIEGGRGSGKTMFLKYHCHPTIFSRNKDEIINEDFEFIGIHWRPDTFFTQNITKTLLGSAWESSFNSFTTLSILIDFSKLINNIANSKYNDAEFKNEIKKFNLPKPIAQALSLDEKPIIDCLDDFEDIQFDLCNWINMSPGTIQPVNIDLKNTLKILIRRLSTKFELLENTTFNIFIDEFENLTVDQQEVVNTWMKHGDKNILFSIAHKKHATVSRKTKSQERIVERNDFRIVDLDQTYTEDFENLAAEVFILKWAQDNEIKELNDLADICSEPKYLNTRKNENYLSNIKKFVRLKLPSMSLLEISEGILNDKVLNNKLRNLIESGLKLNKCNIPIDSFIDEKFPSATIINGALVNRKTSKINPNIVLNNFEKHKKGERSLYDNWIPNNLKGVILYLYKTTSNKTCPIYAGFDQFVLMSKGNLRHFLELCHQAIVRGEDELKNFGADSVIPIETQAKSTKFTSKLELDKISDLGSHGKHLRRIARRLGILFSYSQARKAQSEPEVNHFSIPISERTSLDEKTTTLLNECLMWSVLYEDESTKVKSATGIEEYDYILHPVLSSHFGISPSKRRKLNLSIEDIRIIFTEPDDNFSKILKKFEDKWSINKSLPDWSLSGEQLSLYD